MSRPQTIGLFVIVAALAAYPPVASLFISGLENSREAPKTEVGAAGLSALPGYAASILGARAEDVALTYFAGDAFYYLNVAQRSQGVAHYTYDGTHPTNGFHPLWQYVLFRAFVALGEDKAAQIVFVFGFCAIAVAVGAAFFALALHRVVANVPLAILGAVPGVYALLLAPVDSQHTTWAFVNGMESSLSIALFGVLAYVLLARGLRPTVTGIGLLSTALTLLTLSRLDDIFLFVLLVPLLVTVHRDRPKAYAARAVLLAFTIPVVMIGGYLLHNVSYSGMLLPVSGRAKSEPALADNLSVLVHAFIPVSQAIYATDTSEWRSLSWRLAQTVVPAIVAVVWIRRFWTRIGSALKKAVSQSPPEAFDRTVVLAGLALYVVIKASYNFVAVGMWHQGSWYFPVSLMLTSVLALTLFSRDALESAATLPRGVTRRVGAWPLLATGLFVLLLANTSVDERRRGNYRSRLALWHGREDISRELRARYDGVGLLEFADGVMGYTLDVPTMSGIGLSLDREAADAKQRGGLLDLAYRRGFRAFASLSYFQLAPAADGDDLEVQRTAETFFLLAGQAPERWTFRVIYRDPVSQAVFVGFAPK